MDESMCIISISQQYVYVYMDDLPNTVEQLV